MCVHLTDLIKICYLLNEFNLNEDLDIKLDKFIVKHTQV